MCAQCMPVSGEPEMFLPLPGADGNWGDRGSMKGTEIDGGV